MRFSALVRGDFAAHGSKIRRPMCAHRLRNAHPIYTPYNLCIHIQVYDAISCTMRAPMKSAIPHTYWHSVRSPIPHQVPFEWRVDGVLAGGINNNVGTLYHASTRRRHMRPSPLPPTSQCDTHATQCMHIVLHRFARDVPAFAPKRSKRDGDLRCFSHARTQARTHIFVSGLLVGGRVTPITSGHVYVVIVVVRIVVRIVVGDKNYSVPGSWCFRLRARCVSSSGM